MPELDEIGLPLKLTKGERPIKYGSTTLDDYSIIKQIAQGGYGRVYQAKHKETQLKVAIKQFIVAVSIFSNSLEQRRPGLLGGERSDHDDKGDEGG